MNVMKFFENPDFLWNLLWLLPLFAFLCHYAASRRNRFCRMILGDRAENPEFTSLSKGRRNLKNWLLALALVLLVVTASRPFWGTRILPYSGSGRDLMLVLDVSKSMLADDVKPSRMEHAKWFLRELVKSTPGDRYGLVAFSGSAFLECPMTVDKTSLFQIIDEMRPGSIPLGGTNIEEAINVAMKAFEAAETPHRAIILVSDGDELEGNMARTTKELNERHIPLYVVGVGDPSQPGLVMETDEETGKKVFLKDRKGEIVKSPLNENALAKLAGECNGIYVRSTATKSCIEPLLAKIKSLVPEKYRSGQNTRKIERFHIPLFLAVVLLLLVMLIDERKKTTAALLILCLPFSGLPQDTDAGITAPPPGQQAADKTQAPSPGKDDAEAQAQPVQEQKIRPPEETYNEAVEHHQKNETKEAGDLYQKAINSSEKPGVRGKSFQNLGVIIHEQARELMKKMDLDNAEKLLNNAEEMYRESLASDKNLKDSAMNQQKLLNDRKTLEELRKKQQEMKDKKEQAKDKIQQAMDKNKEAQEKQDQKDQGKEEKQEKKDQKDNKQGQDKEKSQQQKNGEKGDKKEDQKDNESPKNGENKEDQKEEKSQKDGEKQEKDSAQQAREKTEEAKKAVEDYKKEAQKQGDQQENQAAQQAGKEIEKAENNQKQDDFKDAGENLKKALDALGGREEKNKDKQEEKGEKQEQKDKDGQQEKKPAKGEDQASKGDKDEKIDPNQAEALLDLMEKDEKELRDHLNDANRQNSRLKEVEKDW